MSHSVSLGLPVGKHEAPPAPLYFAPSPGQRGLGPIPSTEPNPPETASQEGASDTELDLKGAAPKLEEKKGQEEAEKKQKVNYRKGGSGEEGGEVKK